MMLYLPPKFKHMKLLIAICLMGMIALSCKGKMAEDQPKVEEETELKLSADLQNYEDEIMKIHDEAMAKMNEIHELSAQLRDIRDQATKNPDGSVAIEGLDDTLLALTKADEGMMDWMKRYSETRKKLSPEQLKRFFEKELEKVTYVKMAIVESIEKANAWIAAHPAG